MQIKKDQPFVMSEPPKDYYTYENRNPVGQYVTTFNVTGITKDKTWIQLLNEIDA